MDYNFFYPEELVDCWELEEELSVSIQVAMFFRKNIELPFVHMEEKNG